MFVWSYTADPNNPSRMFNRLATRVFIDIKEQLLCDYSLPQGDTLTLNFTTAQEW